MKSATTSLRRILLSPSFSEFLSDSGSVDVMEEDAISTLSLRVRLNLTVWEFVLPETPSLPAVFGVSSTHIECHEPNPFYVTFFLHKTCRKYNWHLCCLSRSIRANSFLLLVTTGGHLWCA